MKDVEISIKGLFFYCLKHWKSIVIAMIVGATILSGLQVLRRAKGTQHSTTVEDISASLSVSEKAYVESVYEYMNELRHLNETRRQSLIMNLDPSDIIKDELTYMISVDDSESIEGVEEAYRSFLVSSEFTGYISDKTGIDNIDVEETINVSFGERRDSASNSVIGIVVISDDKTEAENIAKFIGIFMDEKYEELSNDGFMHDLKLIRNYIYEGSDLYVQNRQLQLLQEMQSRAKVILDTENTIKDAQKEYYTSLLNGYNNSSDYAEDDLGTIIVLPSKKYILLGLVIGAFFICGVYSLIYISANKLEVDDNIEELFGTCLVGIVTGKDYGKMIYKLQHLGSRTFGFEESVKIISKKIKMTSHKEGVSKVGILGCGIKKNNENVANEIALSLKSESIEAVIIDDPLYDPMSAEELTGVEYVVLLEKAGITLRTEILKEMELIKKLGIKADGLIIAE